MHMQFEKTRRMDADAQVNRYQVKNIRMKNYTLL